MIIELMSGVFLGTFGLAWSHHFLHKYRAFNISVIGKYHMLHHKHPDPEQPLRRQYTMPVYAAVSMIKYTDPKLWGRLDLLLILLTILFPSFGVAFLIGLYIAENIGYLQHTYSGRPIDFTNKFTNAAGFNCGHHTTHHRAAIDPRYSTNTEVIWGLVCAYGWLFFCLLLAPMLILSYKRPNLPGAYVFGFTQNVANYIAYEGRTIRPLVLRMQSVFDSPHLFLQYIRTIWRNEKAEGKIRKYDLPPENLKFSHDVSLNRNVYITNPELACNRNVFVFNGEIIEGHHRHQASVPGLIYWEVL